ncbi:MAG: hypothetical protein M1814_001478 [Vezdaea aestivalis]|nr:MAG: hypothetical protein M1814_001478 [Vezdaea aestivalis]
MSGWEDFSNNLPTDLAPLVALFGEQPTEQYLSECLTIWDIITFATAPLGIITTIVSMIRVRGSPSLRAFIGRAQEGGGTAEAELCSSTSREIVCDNQATGADFYSDGKVPPSAGLYTFKDYIEKLEACSGRGEDWKCTLGAGPTDEIADRGTPKFSRKFAPHPNLSQNVGIKPRQQGWSLGAAVLGVLLQSAVLTWATLARYKLRLIRQNVQDRYAVPFLIMGTLALCTGLGLCASLIESSTEKLVFERDEAHAKNSQLYWMQLGAQYVGHQAFDSFAYTDKNSRLTRYTSSRKLERNEAKVVKLVWFALASIIMGFLLQFLGLRACHSSVAVAQLGITILMSTVRASLRTQRLSPEDNLLQSESDTQRDGTATYHRGYELDWLALKIGSQDKVETNWEISKLAFGFFRKVEPISDPGLVSWSDEYGCLIAVFRANRTDWSALLSKEQRLRDPCDSVGSRNAFFLPHKMARQLLCRTRLSQLTLSWDDRLVAVRGLSRKLARVIQEAAEVIFFEADPYDESDVSTMNKIFWSVRCTSDLNANEQSNNVLLSLSRSTDDKGISTGPWIADLSELEAILGLWIFTIKKNHEGLLDYIGHTQDAENFRILSTKPRSPDASSAASVLALWQERGGAAIREMEASTAQPRIFGWHNPRPQRSKNATVLALPCARFIWKACAQEIFSFFFFAIMLTFKSIGGSTSILADSSYFRMRNSVISRINDSFVKHSLGSMDDALACVIPPLTSLGKLPFGAKDDTSRTTLSWAAGHNQIHLAKMLVETYAVNVDDQDNNGRTPISYAAEIGLEAVVKLLLDNGANFNAIDNDRKSILHHAAENGHETIVKLLLKRGAIVQIMDGKGRSLIHRTA